MLKYYKGFKNFGFDAKFTSEQNTEARNLASILSCSGYFLGE